MKYVRNTVDSSEKLGYLCATHDKNASHRVSGAPQIRAKENSSMLVVHYIFSPVIVVVAMSVGCFADRSAASDAQLPPRLPG